MDIIIGFAILVFFLAVGECISVLIGHFVPGSVIGMLLLFVSLLLGVVKPCRIEKVAHFLTGNMTLFFIPAVMGIMDQWGVISMNWIAWLGVIVISTICVMAASGHMVQLADYYLKKKGGKKC